MNNHLIRVAWTFDDGPSDYTPMLVERLRKTGIRSVTWFVCRHAVYQRGYFSQLQQLQESGSEIAIHEIHPRQEGINWLRRRAGCYQDIRAAIDDFIAFYSELRSYGLQVNFVRLPGGELSELLSYLKLVGCAQEDCYHWAMQIIDGHDVPASYASVKQDYEYLVQSLASFNVKIWAGAPKEYPLMGKLPFHYNSWQAECAGVSTGRGADNVTLHQAKTRREAGILEQNIGVFERTLIKAKQTGQAGSLVVLAHDTSKPDINEIMADINHMTAVAVNNHVNIQYCTMSALYKQIR